MTIKNGKKIQFNKAEIVAAIIEQSNNFLMTKRSDQEDSAPGYWSPVTGQVEINESQKNAVEREVKEEVGINVIAKHKICEFITNDKTAILHWWVTELISGEAKIMTDELVEIKWVTVDEMKQLTPIFKEDIQVFENYSTRQ